MSDRWLNIAAVRWALDDVADVPRSALATLIALASYADDNGANAYPSAATLARHANKSIRAVADDLYALLRCGLIRQPVDQRATKDFRGYRRPTVYDLQYAPKRPCEPIPVWKRDRDETSGDQSHGRKQTAGSRLPEVQRRTSRSTASNYQKQTADEQSLKKTEQGARDALPPVCGRCDARPTDPVSARVIWIGDGPNDWKPCPHCGVTRET